MKSKERKPQVNFEANPNLIIELKDVSKKIEIPVAQFCREAIREKIAVLKKTDPRLQEETETIAA